MEVVLLKDVKGLGNKYDIIEVKPGYGRNYLIPEGVAVLATRSLKKEIEVRQAKETKKRDSQAVEAKKIAQKLKNITLTLLRKVTSSGKLYGSLTEKVIASELKNEHGIEIAQDTIIVPEPIKAVGDYRIEVDLAEDTKGHFKVVVKEEK